MHTAVEIEKKSALGYRQPQKQTNIFFIHRLQVITCNVVKVLLPIFKVVFWLKFHTNNTMSICMKETNT